MTAKLAFIILLSLTTARVNGESIRAMVAGVHRVSLAHQEGTTITLSYASSTVIQIEGDARFFRGIQIELNAPQSFLSFHDSLAAVIYDDLSRIPGPGAADLECRQIARDPLPAKIQTIYQIPLKEGHGLRTSPYATVLTDVRSPSSFPLLFRLMPVIRTIPDELERMTFTINVKPILSDEGALRINFRYPEGLRDRSFTVYINDQLIRNPGEEQLLKEGEHRLVIQSEDYRNQSTRFVIERAKTLDLLIELQDPRPRIIFEYPENARIYIDNTLIPNSRNPLPVEPGLHEIRFQISDYIIIRTLTVQRGRTYRVALSLGVEITEDSQ